MHVLITVNAAWNVWHFRRPVVAALLAEGCRVTVVAPPDAASQKLADMGCDLLPLAMDAKGLNPVRDLALYRQLSAIFRQQRPNVVLSYTIKPNVYGALAARACGIPFIPNVSGLGTAFLSGGILRRAAEFLYRRAFSGLRAIFFQNDEDRDLFVARGLVQASQARLLPGSGIDLEHFAPVPLRRNAGAPVFLMIARLLRDKGVLEYVEAARLVKSRHPAARFQLLGATDAANRTAIDAATVAGWQAEGVIEYLGTTDDVRPLIAAADCVVLPSYREGAPRTLIEAAALARPVIATDVPGCRTVVEAGVTGLLCAPRDAESLAAAMLEFCDMAPELRAAMGADGRRKMEAEYDEALVVDAYRRAINDLVPQANLTTKDPACAAS